MIFEAVKVVVKSGIEKVLVAINSSKTANCVQTEARTKIQPDPGVRERI